MSANTINTTVVLYTSIHKLPLSIFLDVLVDEQHEALIISGTPEPEQLQTAWSEILAQYNLSMQGDGDIRKMQVYKALAHHTAKYNSVTKLIYVLESVYAERLCDHLNHELVTQFKFDITNPDSFENDLERCKNRSKTIQVQIQLKQSELQTIEESEVLDEAKPSREYFDKALINLSNHAGYSISEESITVAKFCQRVSSYNAYYKQLIQAQNGKKADK